MFNPYRDLCNNYNSFLKEHYIDFLESNNEAIKKLQQVNYECASNAIEVSDIAEDTKKKMMFYLKYMSSMSSLDNSIFNPKVIEEAINTKGQSLINGFYNFIGDFSRNFEVKTYNEKAFAIGKNLAMTEGNVVYENEFIQLIYYNPTQEKNYSTPLLIVPPWINKYYILDLQQSNSLVKFLVDMGFPVFMISWVNPDSTFADKGFNDYLLEGAYKALGAIQKIFPKTNKGEDKINILGYCVGGTLVTALSAYLKAKKIDTLKSATLFATLVDFSDVGELGIFIDEAQISMLEGYMKQLGYFDGNHLRTIFSSLKAEDMMAKPFINNYLMGKDPFPFDILYWNSDSTNIPYKLHSDILRNCYLNNLLIKPNGMIINEALIDISKISVPLCFIGAEEDHIIPWKGMYNAASKFAGSASKKFILTGSGHVAGIVNSPVKNKYFYISDFIENNLQPESFLSKEKIPGSWWNDWKDWLAMNSGEIIKSFIIDKNKAIEPAPGKYIRRRIDK